MAPYSMMLLKRAHVIESVWDCVKKAKVSEVFLENAVGGIIEHSWKEIHNLEELLLGNN